jgi:Family of unknown function (DUF5684)
MRHFALKKRGCIFHSQLLFAILVYTKTNTMEFSSGFIIIWLLVVVFIIASIWKTFEKAGQPGWAAIIPIYNIYIMTKIAGKPGWWVLLCFIPLVNIVILIWLYNMISKSFGKDEGFTAGLVLLGFIFWPILGFGSAKYEGPFGDPAAYQAFRGKDKFEFEEPKA